jgi:cytochrome b-561
MAPKSQSYQVSATPVTIFAHLIVIAVTTLVLVWLLHFREGLAFKSTNKSKIFNLHPLLMMIGFILLGGEAIMAYKSVPGPRNSQKLVHLILHLLALLSGILGIYAVFKFKNEAGLSDMVTLHSWFGIITISLFGLQYLLGFFTYFFPGAEMSTRGNLLPWHVFGGMAIFVLGIITAETGLLQSFIHAGLGTNQEGLIVNFTGLLLVLFAVSVGLTVLLPRGFRK